jgi:hypothetical protein
VPAVWAVELAWSSPSRHRNDRQDDRTLHC